ncbi:MAG: IPT/TIG domain-containing protein [Vicinamibacteria bacterium]
MSDASDLRDPHVPVLIVTGGARDGASLVVDTQGFEKVLGSGSDCHLRVEAQNVDFHHARILWDERGVVLSDEGSSTGTYVNGERIGPDHPLLDGDRICLGPPGSRNSVKMLVRVPAEIAEAQTIGFTAPAFDLPVEMDELEAVETAPSATVPDFPPARTAPEPPPILFEPEPEPEPEAIVFQEPPVVFDEPEVAFEAAPVVFEDEGSTIAFEAPAAEAFVPEPEEEPVVPTRRLPTTPDEPFVPTMRLPARVEPAPVPPAPEAPPPLPPVAKARPKPDYAPELPSIAAVRNDLPADEAEAPPAEAPLRRLGKKPPAPARAPKPAGGGGGPSKVLLLAGVAAIGLAIAGALWFLRVPSPATPGSAPATAADDGPPGAPRIASLEPEAALPGRELVLNGANLAGTGVKVTVGGVEAKPIESTPTRLRIVVPKLPIVVEGQSVPVVVQAGSERSKPFDLFLGRLPLVSEITPRAGVPGDRVVVKGRGFDPSPGGNRVSFGDDDALVVTAAGNELSVIVPAPKSSLNRVDAAVVVRRGEASSSADSVIFNITRPPAGVYKLNFFGAAVEGDTAGEQAFVSTEVGPVLLLSGRGAQESVGARASAVAAALNALVGHSPRFEVRSGYAIGAVGRLDPVVVATPLDAAAYARPLDPVMQGQAAQATAAVVSGFWVALLQDTFTLLEKGGRPDRVLELSARGKVLMDLYSESERKIGAGVGVPTNLVSPPTWTIAKGMREMALALPRGGAVAAAAIVGNWSGTLEEAGAAKRSVSLQLRLDGNRLVGTMTTNAGGLDMNAPLGDVKFTGGQLGFTLAGGQTPRRFQGRVNGTQLEGTIQAAAGAPTGRISLRYVE